MFNCNFNIILKFRSLLIFYLIISRFKDEGFGENYIEGKYS